MGHAGSPCPCPTATTSILTVIHINGVHTVRVKWCDCEFFSDKKPRRVQLLRVGWFPATQERPSTAITFDILHFFQLLTIQSKVSFYDYYETLCRVIDNSGVNDHVVSSSKLCWTILIFSQGQVQGVYENVQTMAFSQAIKAKRTWT